MIFIHFLMLTKVRPNKRKIKNRDPRRKIHMESILKKCTGRKHLKRRSLNQRSKLAVLNIPVLFKEDSILLSTKNPTSFRDHGVSHQALNEAVFHQKTEETQQTKQNNLQLRKLHLQNHLKDRKRWTLKTPLQSQDQRSRGIQQPLKV